MSSHILTFLHAFLQKGQYPMKRTILALPLLLCLLAGCGSSANAPAAQDAGSGAPAQTAQQNTEPNTATVYAMDTTMELSVYGDESLLAEAENIITDLEAKVSVTDTGSEIYAINQSGTGTLTGRAAALFARAMEMCARTDGALDISIYPVVRAWGFTTGSYQVPTAAELDALLQNVDYTKIDYNAETGAVTLGADMEVDLGSVTKGYVSGCLTDYFRENGVTSALINLGGNVQALGAKPDGSKWRVAVQNPTGSDYLGVLEIADRAVITSGGYERYFEQDGKTYWHIIDPATGQPANNGLISVTIVGEDGLTCDALSTSLFVMGLERATDFWRNSDDFEAIFVTADDEVYITEGLQDVFTLVDSHAGNDVTVLTRG